MSWLLMSRRPGAHLKLVLFIFTYLVLYFEFDPFIMTVSGLNRESPVNVYLKLSISSFPPTAS